MVIKGNINWVNQSLLAKVPMAPLSNVTERMEHGELCSCKLLAQAAGMDPRALSFGYCHSVLHRHWRMTCHHGQPLSAPVVAGLGEHWRHVGRIDPVKAILMINDQKDEG